MKINGNNRFPYSNQIYQKNSKNIIDKKQKPEILESKDRIELSKIGQEVKRYLDKIEDIDRREQEKITYIKQAIQNKTYQVSSKEIAESMLDKINQQKGRLEE
ncbi:flagellar biosynthesis anti-sigma factor FlgM [Garciella nitratireducens]|uniref:flagellar biosynthesis anti-sigma factor FlgM n=1 Tax=Garciella nitratireducens TaxID=218205 RepID=UPI000DEA1365|nr:flagellar biosynthesis anti-sigma factor FlgM [Garciella nitratireducens]RBP46781.1 FlgM family anti-sigma-28 factor [Garciella nitratireducens]